MLHHGEFCENLGLVHLDQALIHLGPSRDPAYIPELVRMLVKGTSFDFGDILDTTEKHEVLGKGLVVIGFDEMIRF